MACLLARAHFRARACISPESPKFETTRSLIIGVNYARCFSWLASLNFFVSNSIKRFAEKLKYKYLDQNTSYFVANIYTYSYVRFLNLRSLAKLL